MSFKPTITDRIRQAIRLVHPQITDDPTLDLQVNHVMVSGYLLQDATEDEICAAAQALSWSNQRIIELRPITSDDTQPYAVLHPARVEFAALVKFRADRRASSALMRRDLGQPVSVDDADYLTRMLKRRALYSAWHHPLEGADVPRRAVLEDTERTIRRACHLPDSLSDERFAVVIEDYAHIAQVRFWLTDAAERSSRTMSGEQLAEQEAAKHICGDKYAFDLYVRRHMGTTLTADETAYLEAELKRMDEPRL